MRVADIARYSDRSSRESGKPPGIVVVLEGQFDESPVGKYAKFTKPDGTVVRMLAHEWKVIGDSLQSVKFNWEDPRHVPIGSTVEFLENS